MRRSVRERVELLTRLQTAGFSPDDAETLRRISMTLHRWHELECGDGDDNSSWCITRGRKVPSNLCEAWCLPPGTKFQYAENGEAWGRPYIERHFHRGEPQTTYSAVPDRENGAKKRLAKLLARYPGMSAYVQTDLRGCALYVLRPGDVPAGKDASSYYTRGIAVY